MRTRFLTVPVNKKGIEEYDYGIEHTSNLLESSINEDEFNLLSSSGIFSYINSECNLMIDDYESETITASDLQRCMNVLAKYPGAFLTAAKQAISHDTFLALGF